MRLTFNKFSFLFLLVLVLVACSTEKNTLVNRTYHGTTARYNGYFNATELIRQSVTTYRSSLKDNYYAILPIDPLPNTQEVIGLYPAIDTAIAKCTKVIQQHSMPSNDKPSLKKIEHNRWVDENWITIGIANYYRLDYDAALKNFKFVRKFYSNDPSIFVADLWMAKTNIELGKFTDANFNIASIDKAILLQNSADEAKPKNFFKRIKGKKVEETPAEVPQSIRFDLEKTKAELSLRRENTEEAIKHLESSLRFAKKKTDKARVYYILGQLYESLGNNSVAKEQFGLALKFTAPYELHFNARMRRAFLGGDEKVRKELFKMLRDAKNAQFKDQIYYALAEMEIQRSNQPKAIEYLTLSAFYSTSNKRQKGMSYEKLGNMSFASRNYVSAQKYYDSCSKAVDDTYPNAEGVRNKALKLADLVVAVETANFEDSVQRIAALSEKERTAFIENVIKQKKAEDASRKKMDAERLRALQENTNAFLQTDGPGNKWYFNNPKTRAEGFDEFRKLWGSRENEDNWRRSEKAVVMAVNADEADTSTTEIVQEIEKVDSMTVEKLLTDIPLTDSALAISTNRLMDALYAAGLIYKDQLNEPELAKTQFNAVLKRKTEGLVDLSSAYQLYKLNEDVHADIAAEKRAYILQTYPNSDYANYLRDPEFFIKRKEREALAEQEYITVLERYNRGVYYPVISKADNVIENEKENQFRPKYMLLKAMSMGQLTNNKKELLPVLSQLVKEYPKTDEAARANEMIGIIENGYSENKPIDFSNKSPYRFVENAPQWVIIFPDKDESSSVSKTKIADFNKEFFSRNKLKASSKIFTDDQSVILVQEFEDDLKAQEYLRVFKATRKHLLDLQKAKILIITQENMKILFDTQKLSDYQLFYDEYY
jgi:tetratricopeptide (TPR) repeat protein